MMGGACCSGMPRLSLGVRRHHRPTRCQSLPVPVVGWLGKVPCKMRAWQLQLVLVASH